MIQRRGTSAPTSADVGRHVAELPEASLHIGPDIGFWEANVGPDIRNIGPDIGFWEADVGPDIDFDKADVGSDVKNNIAHVAVAEALFLLHARPLLLAGTFRINKLI